MLALRSRAALALAFLLTAVCATARADPADYVHVPAVEYGEREIDFKSGNEVGPGAQRLSQSAIGFGYGATPHWFTEVYVKYETTGGEPRHFDAWEWENKFQLTETGEYPVDVGFLLEIERPKDRSAGYETRFGPLLQTEFGRVQLNGNVLFQRSLRASTPQDTRLGYEWQAKYRWRPEFEFGLQGFGDLGRWDHWDPREQQTNRLGPAVFGRLPVGVHEAIRYNAALLLKASDGAPDTALRVQVEYEF